MLEDSTLYRTYEEEIPKGAPAQIIGSLKELDLDQELYTNYMEARVFLNTLIGNAAVPANQIAQVMNTISTILKEIVKMQMDLLNAERVKKLEACMISAVKLMDEDAQNEFLKSYETMLGNLE